MKELSSTNDAAVSMAARIIDAAAEAGADRCTYTYQIPGVGNKTLEYALTVSFHPPEVTLSESGEDLEHMLEEALGDVTDDGVDRLHKAEYNLKKTESEYNMLASQDIGLGRTGEERIRFALAEEAYNAAKAEYKAAIRAAKEA